MRVSVIGGSLGGLTAALLLRDLAMTVHIYERSPVELAQGGAGIGFLPESQRYLVERAGVDLDEISVATSHIRYLDRDARVIYDGTRHYRFSSLTTVYRQLLKCIDPALYHLDHEMTGWETGHDGIHVHFSRQPSQRADLLICADGVGSMAWARPLPEVDAQYAGYVCWRGVVAAAELDKRICALFDDAITYYVNANSHALIYPIPGPDGSVKRGERLLNGVWYRNYLAGGDPDDLMTDSAGEKREISLPPGTVGIRHVDELRAVACRAAARADGEPGASARTAVFAGDLRHRHCTYGVRQSLPARRRCLCHTPACRGRHRESGG